MKTKKQCLIKYILYTILFKRRKCASYKHKLEMFHNNKISVSEKQFKHINIDITGKNNSIVIKDTVNAKLNIIIFGDNNTVYIDDNVYAGKLDITIGQDHKNFGPVHHCDIKIGKQTTFESTQIVIKNSNAKLSIGKRCMFAFNIMLYHTDSHPVFDLESGKIINKVQTMHIGDHVWVGANTTILKNTNIANDCIIGWGSVVSGKFSTQHSAIAGNPAKIIKHNITWDCDGSKGYVQNEK